MKLMKNKPFKENTQALRTWDSLDDEERNNIIALIAWIYQAAKAEEKTLAIDSKEK